MKKVKNEKKKSKAQLIILIVALIAAIAALVFIRYGGFGPAKAASDEEYAKYAKSVQEITIPQGVRVVALGEASHGNAEFQALKLSVFKRLVEAYGVRAFALEGDFGGCEQVNRYIHGGQGTADEAAAAIGFAIYRTDEIAQLISYMREYNENAAEGDDLRFYGFDMQRAIYSYNFLIEECEKRGIDASELKMLVIDNDWSQDFGFPEREDVIAGVKAALEKAGAEPKALQYAEILLQFCEIQGAQQAEYAEVRDGFMAKNILWIKDREEEAGHNMIFISAHNGHVAKWGTLDTGKLLDEELKSEYYVIGTDFYRTLCNLPSGNEGKRANHVFYSADPLAGAAKNAKKGISWLDFSEVPQESSLQEYLTGYHYMGSLGEGYSVLIRVLPPAYRIFQPPATLYDSMIFVDNATPTVIKDK